MLRLFHNDAIESTSRSPCCSSDHHKSSPFHARGDLSMCEGSTRSAIYDSSNQCTRPQSDSFQRNCQAYQHRQLNLFSWLSRWCDNVTSHLKNVLYKLIYTLPVLQPIIRLTLVLPRDNLWLQWSIWTSKNTPKSKPKCLAHHCRRCRCRGTQCRQWRIVDCRQVQHYISRELNCLFV